MCVHCVNELIHSLLVAAYGSRYSIHPGARKMFHDLRQLYWLRRMNDLADYKGKCQNFQHVKYEHHKTTDLLLRMPIPK